MGKVPGDPRHVAGGVCKRMKASDIVQAEAAREAPRPKIVIAANAAWNLVNFRSSLIGALGEAGYEVVAAGAPDAVAERSLVALGCRFHAVAIDSKGLSPARDLRTFLAFRRLMQRERPIAFLGYTIKPNVYGSLAAARQGVAVVNNISGLGTAFIRRSWLTHVVSALYRLALRRSEVVFFQNESDRSLFLDEAIVRPGQTALLPGSGIDTKRFAPVTRPADRPEGEIVFLLIARLVRDKGVNEYVEAARQLKARHPRFRFQLLGFLDVDNRTAISREAVEAWVSEGIVDYLGPSEDVRPAIAAADVVVLPSYREGTSRVLLEAASMARPLVTTDVPGCREVVEDGVNGLLCRARDAADLADKMERIGEMSAAERETMGRAGRAKVIREFDERIVLERYLEAVARIAARSAPAETKAG